MQGKSDSEIATAYSSLGVSLGANVLQTLNFATGSSELTPEDDKAIRTSWQSIPDGDLASRHRLRLGNRQRRCEPDTVLGPRHRRRAIDHRTSNAPNSSLRPSISARPDRFSSRIPERNQIVEIWHIRKK